MTTSSQWQRTEEEPIWWASKTMTQNTGVNLLYDTTMDNISSLLIIYMSIYGAVAIYYKYCI